MGTVNMDIRGNDDIPFGKKALVNQLTTVTKQEDIAKDDSNDPNNIILSAAIAAETMVPLSF